MTDTHRHIVCFAPYTDWSIHSARQVTILHGLRQRGASVTYVTCDGVFSDCDLFQAATGAKKPRDAQSCLVCQASVASRLAAWSMPFRWLGSWLTTQDRDDAGTAAIRNALNTDSLRNLRTSLRNRMKSSALLDHLGFTRSLENAFAAMWRDACGETQSASARVIDVKAEH